MESNTYCMDCMEAMRQMPNNCFDLAIVDPPYFSGPEKRGVTHNLKTLPEYFDASLQGIKPFEVRRNDRDRDYRVGDFLRLQEWEPINGYTGRTLDKQITYILNDPMYCKEGYVILGVAVHGQWMNKYKRGTKTPRGAVCSNCDWWSAWDSKYCPRCGAKMDGGKENE